MMMRSTNSLATLAVLSALAIASPARAGSGHEHPTPSSSTGAQKSEPGSHTPEACQLHGGQVSMTKMHHFETVFVPDGVLLYIYSDKQIPMQVGKAQGTLTLKHADGRKQEVPLSAQKSREGEKTAYFCPAHAEATRMEPGICRQCGTMKLMAQDFLFAPVDLSKVEPGSATAVLQIKGMRGEEAEATLTETCRLRAKAEKEGSGDGGHDHGH